MFGKAVRYAEGWWRFVFALAGVKVHREVFTDKSDALHALAFTPKQLHSARGKRERRESHLKQLVLNI